MTRHTLHLRGCTPEPLGNYLKGLGVFRLIAEQADPQARAWWQDGYLHVATKWPDDVIVSFFLHGFGDVSARQDRIYAPTPIFAPWGGRPGFYPDSHARAKAIVARIRELAENLPRFTNARQTIERIDQTLRTSYAIVSERRKMMTKAWIDLKKQNSPKIDQRTPIKYRMSSTMRNVWDRAAIDWLDACIALDDDVRFGFLYGSGGNEGNADITNNFWEMVFEVTACSDLQSVSRKYLERALLGTHHVGGGTRTVGQHFPQASGSPNCSQAFEASSSTNPWDFILMMEGAILFSGGATKRLSHDGRGKAAFPFMFEHLAIDSPSTAITEEASKDKQAARCRAEFWMPLWSRPTTFHSIRSLLKEGRMQRSSGRAIEHTVHAFEAINSLGVSRGIDAFHRVALFERRGQGSYLAASLGYHSTKDNSTPSNSLLAEFEAFRQQVYRNLRAGPGVPDRIMRARRNLHSAIASVTQSEEYNSQDELLNLLVALSTVELEVCLVKDHKQLMAPIPPLTKRWNSKGDGSHEYNIARSIASIAAWGETSTGDSAVAESIRANLLPVERKYRTWRWDDTSRCSVWSRGASIDNNLAAILRRRLIDCQRGRGDGLPLWTSYGVGFSSVLAFWNCEIDESRIAALTHGLALIDSGKWDTDRIIATQRHRDPTPDLQTGGVYFTPDGDARTKLKTVQWLDKMFLSKVELQAAFELPRAYHLLKLCFVGGQLPRRPVDRQLVARTGDEPFPANSLDILTLLQAGRLSDALILAARRLRAKGYPSLLNDADSASIDMEDAQCRRLAGMMLIPIRHPGVCAALAIKPQITNS